MKPEEDISALRQVLNRLKEEGKISLAFLYGSFAKGLQHPRSDIDIAIYLNVTDEKERISIIDEVLMTSDRDIEILLLNDEDESPFVVQEAIKGIPLIEPDLEVLYKVAHRVLHEAESIRLRRALSYD